VPGVKERLEVLRASLDSAAIGRALAMAPTEVDRLFHDGRAAAPFCEVWALHLFGYRGRRNRNEPITGALEAELTHDVQVRTMVQRIKFQPSGDQGKGRSSSQEKMVAALERVETWVVADVRCWPSINFYPIDTKLLLREAWAGRLGVNGWTAKQFERWLAQTYVIRLEPVTLTRLAASSNGTTGGHHADPAIEHPPQPLP
jgi:hypothetical protein